MGVVMTFPKILLTLFVFIQISQNFISQNKESFLIKTVNTIPLQFFKKRLDFDLSKLLFYIDLFLNFPKTMPNITKIQHAYFQKVMQKIEFFVILRVFKEIYQNIFNLFINLSKLIELNPFLEPKLLKQPLELLPCSSNNPVGVLVLKIDFEQILIQLFFEF